MRISIIIPTLNAGKTISGVILSLQAQSFPPREILIIDSSSDDNTVNIASQLGCKVKVIGRKDFNHGDTRNLGVELISGEAIVFLTQDVLPVDETFLQNLVLPLQEGKVAASFGRQIAFRNAIPPERFARSFNYPEVSVIKNKGCLPEMGIKTFFFSNSCSAVKRKAFEEVGCFPSGVIMNEDMFLAAKLILQGYEIAYAADARVWHSHNYGWAEQFRRYFDIGVFHNMNRWLLEYAKAEKEGFRFIKQQFRYLINNKLYLWIPYTVGLTVAKYSGYKLGLIHDKLPRIIIKSCSMHKHFWSK